MVDRRMTFDERIGNVGGERMVDEGDQNGDDSEV